MRTRTGTSRSQRMVASNNSSSWHVRDWADSQPRPGTPACARLALSQCSHPGVHYLRPHRKWGSTVVSLRFSRVRVHDWLELGIPMTRQCNHKAHGRPSNAGLTCSCMMACYVLAHAVVARGTRTEAVYLCPATFLRMMAPLPS